ncbi:Mfi, partial [Symbiodinium pilosum]
FPPTIYYKIYTHGNVVDLGSFAPRDYHLERQTQETGLAVPGDHNWYRRIENNGWRPLAVRLKNTSASLEDEEMEKLTARRPPRKFHYSKLRRRADMERIRKLRKIEWFQKLYGVSQASQEMLSEVSPTSPIFP